MDKFQTDSANYSDPTFFSGLQQGNRQYQEMPLSMNTSERNEDECHTEKENSGMAFLSLKLECQQEQIQEFFSE